MRYLFIVVAALFSSIDVSAQPIATEFCRDRIAALPSLVAVVRQDGGADEMLPVLWEGDTRNGDRAVIRGTVRVQPDEEFEEFEKVEPLLVVELHHGDEVRLYRPTIETWTNDCPHNEFDSTIRATPFGAGKTVDGVLVSWSEIGCGMHGSADIEHLMAMDLRAKEPKAVVFELGEYESWGYANGGILSVDQEIRCTWTNGDFDCAQREFIEGDWSKTEYVRRFTAFGLKPLRFETGYQPRVSALDAIATMAAVRRSILADGIGFLSPVTTISESGGIVQIFASAQGDDRLAADFYAVSDGTVTKVTPEELVPVKTYPCYICEENPDRAIPFTRITDVASFRASTLAVRGSTRLLQVVMDVGTQRALFWLAVGRVGNDLRLSALRVAATAAEGTSREKRVPASLTSFTMPRGNSPVIVEAISPWMNDVFGGPNSCDAESEDEPASKGIPLAGTIAWSPETFIVALQPQTSSSTHTRVTIAPDGKLGTEAIKCPEEQ